MKFRTAYLLLLALTFIACKPEPDDPPVVLPTNLATTLTVDEGQVDVAVSANNANFYTVTFYDGGDSTVIESTDGVATYNFTANGTYSIKSRAHATYADFIEVTETADITLPGGGNSTVGYTTPLTYPGYTLVWHDEFDGTALSADWVFETGNGQWGWGNNELQYYKEQNVEVVDGLLKITAREENFGGSNYTSSRIKTQGKQSFEYGRIDIRAQLPYGQGIWPALWMLGDNITSVSWPACGEIDIMEMVGGSGNKDRTTHGTIHWEENGSHAYSGQGKSLSSGRLADEFHVYSIVWDQSSITWFLDDVQFHVEDISSASRSEFQDKFFFIFNVAVGGNWPGSPDATTVFPQVMAVDYVRVFQ
ncbi:UNVERIFIED_CONTAM: hypothetical protein GTU68_029195 [Idotea baltica]|nr:hypothetical protein [Idotea baltica]